MTSRQSLSTVAAVDLGSNSFHLVVARLSKGELAIVDRLRERTRLAAGIDEKKKLTDEAQERALACIARFGERLRGLPSGSVRAVGTSALRLARNARAFVSRAEEALGHGIEIVSGLEEARLIYLGVAHDLSDDRSRRLVIDIGGGSTECILGERFEALRTDSLHMGCVNWSARYFENGAIDRESMSRARLAARLEVQTLERAYQALGWQECIGSSGTALAIEEILRANAWSDAGITKKGLRKLRKELVEIGRVEELAKRLPGLAEERADVIAGGVAILSALFDGLDIETLRTSQGAMREGVLYDLVGRIRHEDVRDRTIKAFRERYHVDLEQAGRVARTALALFASAREALGVDRENGERLLEWAAQLHEIGLSLSYSGYHHHGAYIVENSDMPGFSREDQLALAALIEGQRRRFPPPRLASLGPAVQRDVSRLCVILRLAVLLNRSRGRTSAPAVAIEAKKSGIRLRFAADGLDENPLLREDVAQERERLAAQGFDVEIS